MVRPDFLPVTVMFISRDRDRRFFRASFDGGLLLMLTSSASPSTSPVRRAVVEIRPRIKSSNHRAFASAGQNERGARQAHKRLLYYFNVNRTSLDHLLLGGNADVDKSVECADYSAGLGAWIQKRRDVVADRGEKQ